MAAYFSTRSYRFLRDITRNNERAWFNANRERFERDVRIPFQQLLCDLQPHLSAISPHYVADPRPVGGSLYRIQRDTRRYRDKAPYKSWQDAELFYGRRHAEAPSFFVHVEPGQCYLAAGLWWPEPAMLRRVRQFIVDNPESWNAALASVRAAGFEMQQELKLTRAPRGFEEFTTLADELRLKQHVIRRALADEVLLGPGLLEHLVAGLQQAAPFVDYLCAALELDF